jgi:pyrimidine operon attenuation protein/uracil phosphoribosyltransferase
MATDRNYILSKEDAERKLQRMAYEIVERNSEETDIILAGIKENGLAIAHQLKTYLQPLFTAVIPVIEISLDKKKQGKVDLNPAMPLDEKVIIVVDDVVNSGKTLLYALKPFLEAHPKKIQTLVLVERTHKLFPVTSDYVGISLATTIQENIIVEVAGNLITGAYME